LSLPLKISESDVNRLFLSTVSNITPLSRLTLPERGSYTPRGDIAFETGLLFLKKMIWAFWIWAIFLGLNLNMPILAPFISSLDPDKLYTLSSLLNFVKLKSSRVCPDLRKKLYDEGGCAALDADKGFRVDMLL